MKRFFLLIPCAFVFLSAASCGRSISDSQAFKSNQGPVISDISYTFPTGITGSTLANNMVVKITVAAEDPEGKELRFSFASEAGTIGNIANTATGCTAELYTTNVRSGAEVRLTATAKDIKGAVETRKDLLVGSGRKGANILIDTPAAAAIMPTKNTGFAFHSDTNGYYQIVCQAAQPTGADESLPIYMYTAAGDVSNPKIITADIAGFSSTSNAKVRLSAAADGNYRVWLVFWDDFRQYTFKDMTVTQDGTPPAFVSISPNTTGQGVNTNVEIVFDEPVSVSDSDFIIIDALANNVTAKFAAPSVSGSTVLFAAKAGLDNYETYIVKVKEGAKITDRAGNETTLTTQTQNFSTIEKGTLAAPVFRTSSSGPAVADGTVYGYSTGESIHAVYAGSESGVHVCWKSAVSAVPANPAQSDAASSDETISFSQNTTIKAAAYLKGYKPSAVSQVSVKMKTKTPVITDIARTSGTPYPSDSTIFHSTSPISFSKSSGTGYYLSSTTSDGTTPAAPAADPTTSDTTAPTLANDNQRIIFKVRTQDANMEMSDSYISPVYRRRDLVRPNGTSNVAVSGYDTSYTAGQSLQGPNWTSVASSENGQHLAATADNAGALNKGGIFTSDDYGVTWTDHSGHPAFASTKLNWNKIVSSASGEYLAATDITAGGKGDIWVSSNSGTDWVKKTPAAQGNWLISMRDDGTLAAAEYDTKIIYYLAPGSSLWSNLNSNSTHPIRNILIGPVNAELIEFYALTVDAESLIWREYFSLSWHSCLKTNDITSMKHFVCSDTGRFVATGTNEYNTTLCWINDFTFIGDDSQKNQHIGSGPWSGFAISDNGEYVTAIERNNPFTYGGIHRNTIQNVFDLWSPNIFTINGEATPYPWTGIASDDSGAMLAAAAYGMSIWSGIGTVKKQGDPTNETWSWTWYNQNMRSWSSIACSADGQYVLACDKGYGHGGYIYRSEDWGSSWNIVKTFDGTSSLQRPWKKVAISKDGLFAAAIAGNEMFYSNNGGKDWNKYILNIAAGVELGDVSVSGISGSGAIAAAYSSNYLYVLKSNGEFHVNGMTFSIVHNGIFVSNDASQIFFTSNSSYPIIYASRSNSYTTFTYSNPVNIGNKAGGFIAADSNAQTIYYTSGDELLKVSNLSTTVSCGIPGKGILGLSISSDGKCIWVLCQKDLSDNAGGIAFSADSGATWQMQTTVASNSWTCFAAATSFLSADGIKPSVYLGAVGSQNITVLK